MKTEKYAQYEKDFRLDLANLLDKYKATLMIEDTDVVDYLDIPNFGTLYKKTIEVSFEGHKSPHYEMPNIELGNELNVGNVFDVYKCP